MRAISRPCASVVAAILHCYFRLIGPSLVVSIRFPASNISGGDYVGATRIVLDQSASRPCFYVLWTSDHLGLMALPYASPALHEFTRQFHFFADDSFGGYVMQHLLARLGAGCVPLSQADAVTRLKLLRQVVVTKISGFLVVDGRGPYFEVATGLVNLAKATDAAIIPCAAVSAPAISVPNNRVALALPVRRSEVVLTFGEPIIATASSADPLVLAAIVRDSINAVRSAALESLRSTAA